MRCAGVRIESRHDVRDVAAKVGDHLGDDMIVEDQQPAGQYLHGQMPVAEMPGQPRQVLRRSCPYFQKLFRAGPDVNKIASLQHQRIAIAQMHGFRQIQQDFEAALARHSQAAAMAVVVIEDDLVGCLGGWPGTGANI